MDCAGSLPHLVTEHLDLGEGPVDGSAAAAVVAVGVDLDDQRHPLHALLRGEVCAQTVHRDKDLRNKQKTEGRLHFWRGL